MESSNEINVEKSEKIRSEWNSFSELYEDFAENNTMQSSIMLYSLTNVRKANTVCEVGVGCGLAARMFVSQIMKQGAVYFASDISDEMNLIFAKRFKDSFELEDSGTSISKNEKVGIYSVDSQDSLDVNLLIEEMGDASKKVFITRVNNEALPYPNDYFDVYISNLSLMIVSNHHNQLSEAYRVLKQGGRAAFSVWGRKENSEFFTLIPQTIKRCGFELPPPGDKSPFHLSNKDDLEKDVLAAGFSEVKLFYSATNINIENPDELFEFFYNSYSLRQFFSNISSDQCKTLREEFNKLFSEKFGPSSTNPITVFDVV